MSFGGGGGGAWRRGRASFAGAPRSGLRWTRGIWSVVAWGGRAPAVPWVAGGLVGAGPWLSVGVGWPGGRRSCRPSSGLQRTSCRGKSSFLPPNSVVRRCSLTDSIHKQLCASSRRGFRMGEQFAGMWVASEPKGAGRPPAPTSKRMVVTPPPAMAHRCVCTPLYRWGVQSDVDHRQGE